MKFFDRELENGGRSEIIPAAVKVNGDIDGRSSAASEDDLKRMMDHTRAQARRLKKEILEGNVSREPYELDGQTPCVYCAYRSICDGGEKRKLSAKIFPDAWREEEP